MIRRAKVLDEGINEAFVLYREGQHVNRKGESVQYTRKLWANTYGLHVQDQEDESVWTVYPWHTVLWYEEVRT